MHALCNVKALLSNGVLRMRELADAPEESFIAKCIYCLVSILFLLITCTCLRRENREHHVFTALLQMVPGLEGHLMEGSNDDLTTIAEMVRLISVLPDVLHLLLLQIQKGVSSCRSDDTKTLKGAILDWIVPRGQSLDPPLDRNIKADRGFCHERTGALLCPVGMDWTDPECVISSVRVSILIWLVGQRSNYEVAREWLVVANGRFSYILTANSTPRTLGGVCLRVPSWFQ